MAYYVGRTHGGQASWGLARRNGGAQLLMLLFVGIIVAAALPFAAASPIHLDSGSPTLVAAAAPSRRVNIFHPAILAPASLGLFAGAPDAEDASPAAVVFSPDDVLEFRTSNIPLPNGIPSHGDAAAVIDPPNRTTDGDDPTMVSVHLRAHNRNVSSPYYGSTAEVAYRLPRHHRVATWDDVSIITRHPVGIPAAAAASEVPSAPAVSCVISQSGDWRDGGIGLRFHSKKKSPPNVDPFSSHSKANVEGGGNGGGRQHPPMVARRRPVIFLAGDAPQAIRDFISSDAADGCQDTVRAAARQASMVDRHAPVLWQLVSLTEEEEEVHTNGGGARITWEAVLQPVSIDRVFAQLSITLQLASLPDVASRDATEPGQQQGDESQPPHARDAPPGRHSMNAQDFSPFASAARLSKYLYDKASAGIAAAAALIPPLTWASKVIAFAQTGTLSADASDPSLIAVSYQQAMQTNGGVVTAETKTSNGFTGTLRGGPTVSGDATISLSAGLSASVRIVDYSMQSFSVALIGASVVGGFFDISGELEGTLSYRRQLKQWSWAPMYLQLGQVPIVFTLQGFLEGNIGGRMAMKGSVGLSASVTGTLQLGARYSRQAGSGKFVPISSFSPVSEWTLQRPSLTTEVIMEGSVYVSATLRFVARADYLIAFEAAVTAGPELEARYQVSANVTWPGDTAAKQGQVDVSDRSSESGVRVSAFVNYNTSVSASLQFFPLYHPDAELKLDFAVPALSGTLELFDTLFSFNRTSADAVVNYLANATSNETTLSPGELAVLNVPAAYDQRCVMTTVFAVLSSYDGDASGYASLHTAYLNGDPCPSAKGITNPQPQFFAFCSGAVPASMLDYFWTSSGFACSMAWCGPKAAAVQPLLQGYNNSFTVSPNCKARTNASSSGSTTTVGSYQLEAPMNACIESTVTYSSSLAGQSASMTLTWWYQYSWGACPVTFSPTSSGTSKRMFAAQADDRRRARMPPQGATTTATSSTQHTFAAESTSNGSSANTSDWSIVLLRCPPNVLVGPTLLRSPPSSPRTDHHGSNSSSPPLPAPPEWSTPDVRCSPLVTVPDGHCSLLDDGTTTVLAACQANATACISWTLFLSPACVNLSAGASGSLSVPSSAARSDTIRFGEQLKTPCDVCFTFPKVSGATGFAGRFECQASSAPVLIVYPSVAECRSALPTEKPRPPTGWNNITTTPAPTSSSTPQVFSTSLGTCFPISLNASTWTGSRIRLGFAFVGQVDTSCRVPSVVVQRHSISCNTSGSQRFTPTGSPPPGYNPGFPTVIANCSASSIQAGDCSVADISYYAWCVPRQTVPVPPPPGSSSFRRLARALAAGAGGEDDVIQIDSIRLSQIDGTPLSVAEVQIWNTSDVNLALSGTVQQTSTGGGFCGDGPAVFANDGNTDCTFCDHSVTHTTNSGPQQLTLALNAVSDVSRVVVFNRCDCCADRLATVTLSLLRQGIVLCSWALTSDGVQTFSNFSSCASFTSTLTAIPTVTNSTTETETALTTATTVSSSSSATPTTGSANTTTTTTGPSTTGSGNTTTTTTGPSTTMAPSSPFPASRGFTALRLLQVRSGPVAVAEVQVWVNGTNVARAANVTQSSTFTYWCASGAASHANDGNVNCNFCSGSVQHTTDSVAPGQWLLLAFDTRVVPDQVVIYNRCDCCWDYLATVSLQLLGPAPTGVAGEYVIEGVFPLTASLRQSISGDSAMLNAPLRPDESPAALTTPLLLTSDLGGMILTPTPSSSASDAAAAAAAGCLYSNVSVSLALIAIGNEATAVFSGTVAASVTSSDGSGETSNIVTQGLFATGAALPPSNAAASSLPTPAAGDDAAWFPLPVVRLRLQTQFNGVPSILAGFGLTAVDLAFRQQGDNTSSTANRSGLSDVWRCGYITLPLLAQMPGCARVATDLVCGGTAAAVPPGNVLPLLFAPLVVTTTPATEHPPRPLPSTSTATNTTIASTTVADVTSTTDPAAAAAAAAANAATSRQKVAIVIALVVIGALCLLSANAVIIVVLIRRQSRANSTRRSAGGGSSAWSPGDATLLEEREMGQG